MNDNSKGQRFLPREEWRQQTYYDTYSSQISILSGGLKLLATAQGGGVVVLLSLMASITTKCTNSLALTPSVGNLALGLGILIFGTFVSYLAQVGFLKFLDTEKKVFLYLHISAFYLALAAVLFSIYLFYEGVSTAGNILSEYKCIVLNP